MSNTHKPKYLKQEPPTTQEMEDAEVFAMVHKNPSRKVDANTLPPIAMDNNGKLFFTDPAPTAEAIWNAIWGVAVLGLALLIGVYAVVFLAVNRTAIPTVITWLVIGAMSTFAIIKLKGEKKNVQ